MLFRTFPFTAGILAGESCRNKHSTSDQRVCTMTSLDWYIVAGYLGLILVLGFAASRRVEKLFDYFLAGRTTAVWVVVISIIATETSAATVIGGPDTSYRSNLAYVQTTIGAVLSRFFLAYFFIDVYYRHGVYTVYGYLAKRFGFVEQTVTALVFCVGRLFASGARLYIASFAVATIASVNLITAILLVGAVALLYGVFGGLRAVMWTDVVQGILFLLGGVFALLLIVDTVGGVSVLWETARGSGKLEMFDFNVDIFSVEFWKNPYTFIGAVLGGFTLGVATHRTDQDMVQRMLSCRTSREGRKSLIYAGLMEIFVVLLFVSLGVALWAFYQQSAVAGPSETESVFPHFIRTSIPSGVRGLLLAAILAAAMSSLDSAITALSSVSVADVYFPFRGWRTGQHTKLEDVEADHRVLKTSRWLSLFWGLLLIIIAYVLGTYHQSLLKDAGVSGFDLGRSAELLTLALGVMALIYGPLLGVFLVGIFTSRGSTKSLLSGMAAGLLVVSGLKFASSIEIGWTWHIIIGCLITTGIALLGNSRAQQE